MTDLIGRRLGKYQIVERMAEGGMAEVFRAFQPGVERQVVVKVLHWHLAGRPDSVARFQREARVIGSLHHPHIVRIIDIDTQDGLYFMVMDYIQGGTLADYIKERRILAEAEAMHIGLQLANALAAAHTQGIIHRDIKPSNVMFADHTHTHVLLADFGLARLCEDDNAELTIPGAMIGTPAYMSPEALRGEICDGRADVYGLGVVLYQLLTGTTPYVANTPYSMMAQQANEPLPSPRTLNPALSVAMEELLLQALAKEPAMRFQSAADFADAIQQMQTAPSDEPIVQVQKQPAPAKKTTPNPAKVAYAKWAPFVFAASGVVLTALLTVALFLQ